MADTKEQSIPNDLQAMSLEQLYAEEKRDTSAEWNKLLAARDAAQERLSAYTQRKRDITRAIIAKLKAKR